MIRCSHPWIKPSRSLVRQSTLRIPLGSPTLQEYLMTQTHHRQISPRRFSIKWICQWTRNTILWTQSSLFSGKRIAVSDLRARTTMSLTANRTALSNSPIVRHQNIFRWSAKRIESNGRMFPGSADLQPLPTNPPKRVTWVIPPMRQTYWNMTWRTIGKHGRGWRIYWKVMRKIRSATYTQPGNSRTEYAPTKLLRWSGSFR